jgi:hypothetical protein
MYHRVAIVAEVSTDSQPFLLEFELTAAAS